MAKKIGQLQKLVKLQKEKMIKEGLIVEEEVKENTAAAADAEDAGTGEARTAIKWNVGDACYAEDQADSMWHEGELRKKRREVKNSSFFPARSF